MFIPKTLVISYLCILYLDCFEDSVLLLMKLVIVSIPMEIEAIRKEVIDSLSVILSGLPRAFITVVMVVVSNA